MKQNETLLCAKNLKKYFVAQQRGFELFWRTLSQWKSSNPRNLQAFKDILAENRAPVREVDGVSLSIAPGEIVGIVGRSGSGKTTLARLLLRLLNPTEGQIWFDGEEITDLSQAKMRPCRKNMRMMFQSPAAALNPLLTIRQILTEAICEQTELPRKKWDKKLRELLEMVKLPSNVLEQCPGDLSGGLQRRVSIARTLVSNPKLIVADEPVAALDVSIQAQIINLMKWINKEQEVAYLLISHDISMVRYLSDRILVMCDGRIVEEGNASEILTTARHPYTIRLLRSANYNLASMQQ